MYFATKVVLYTQIIPNDKVSTQQSNLLYYKTTKWKLSSVYVRAVQGGGFKTHCVSTRRFESCCTHTKKLHYIIKYQKAPLTQLVEWWSYEPQVAGSNPAWSNPQPFSFFLNTGTSPHAHPPPLTSTLLTPNPSHAIPYN